MKATRKVMAGLAALAMAACATPGHQAPQKDIVDTAVAAGSFNTLVTAVKKAGLVEALKGPGPLTVFAPTDAAFAKLPPGTIDALLRDPERLKGILTYHVAAGNMKAGDVVSRTQIPTLHGASLGVKASGGKVMIDGARVIQADIACSNGVIHVIDAVVLPKSGDGASGR